jgi:trehalose 6-phosphate synthase
VLGGAVARIARFLSILLVGLAMLAGAGYSVLSQTTGRWFERDLELRVELVAHSAREGLLRSWPSPAAPSSRRLDAMLAELTRDERIMAAAACADDGQLLAATEAYPSSFSCASVLARTRQNGEASARTATEDLPSGPIFLSATTVADDDGARIGSLVLLHDLSFVGRREATTRTILLVAFFILAVAASLFTWALSRVARRTWTRDLQRALSGHGNGTERPPSELAPLLRDVRSLAAELAREREGEARGGPWSPERLRATLRQHLHGERIVVLANREPYIHDRRPDGSIQVLHPASGLVSALEPVMRACSGVWVAHGAGSADRDVVDARDRVRVPPGEESYLVRRVWLGEQEEAGYYYGFSNEGLWPLCHTAHARPIFRASDWEQYVAVNQRFADAVCDEVDGDDPVVLVQDYHFALAPRMIRARLPRATILTFWHIPWPNAERLGICPYREAILAGLMGSSIIGFHTQQHVGNFLDSVDAYMESRIDREAPAVVQGGHRTLVRSYPISIEWPVRWLKDVPPVPQCRAELRRELGLAPDALIGVGIDRLDYTKGIEERLLAVDELLQRHPHLRGRFTFLQLAAPSRTKIDRYRELNDRVEAIAREINERWSAGSYRPIVLLRRHHEPPEVFRTFRAAELCYVSSLHDGMNLVAKEFAAARDDEQGVLLLSQFTGAARDLTEALIVNPYDLREAADAMATALKMSPHEQRERLRSMRRLIAEFNVYRWAGRMLVDAAELRRRERIGGPRARLAQPT